MIYSQEYYAFHHLWLMVDPSLGKWIRYALVKSTPFDNVSIPRGGYIFDVIRDKDGVKEFYINKKIIVERSGSNKTNYVWRIHDYEI